MGSHVLSTETSQGKASDEFGVGCPTLQAKAVAERDAAAVAKGKGKGKGGNAQAEKAGAAASTDAKSKSPAAKPQSPGKAGGGATPAKDAEGKKKKADPLVRSVVGVSATDRTLSHDVVVSS